MRLSLKRYLAEHKSAVIIFLCIAAVNSAAAFLLPVSIGEFFRIAFHTDGSKGKLLDLLGIHMESLESFYLYFLSLILIRALAEYSEKYIASRMGERLVKGFRDKLFREQLHWGAEKFGQKHFGNYLLRYSNDMKSIQQYLSRGWLGGSREMIYLFMGFAVLFIINQPLALLYESVFIVILIFFFLFSRRQRIMIIDSRNRRSALLAFVTRSFQQHGKIGAEGKQEGVMDKYEGRSAELLDANMANNLFESLFQALLPLFQYVMIGTILLAMSMSGYFSISAGQALVFVLIMLQMNGALKRLLKVLPALNKGRISLRKVNEIISDNSEKQ